MPTVISTNPGTVYLDAPPHRVYTRTLWAASWVLQEHLYCDRLEFAAHPTLPTATLTWRYGLGMPAGETTFAAHARQELEGQYVKIEVDEVGGTTLRWYGVIVEVPEDRSGALVDSAGTRTLTGLQELHAVGLEYLLSRQPLAASHVERTAPGPGQPSPYEIARAIGFNLGGGDEQDEYGERLPNRSVDISSEGTYVFAESLFSAADWRTRDIVEYLLRLFAPVDSLGLRPLDWDLDQTVSLTHLEAFKPSLPAQGRTVLELLGALINRDILSGWHVKVDHTATPEVPTIKVFTFNDATITLPDATVIVANPDQYSFDFDRAFDITLAGFTTTVANQFDQVICRGGRRGYVFTISGRDATIEADWTTTQRAEYNTAASGAADYGTLDDDEKKLRNANYRAQDTLERVFSWFKVPTTWDGQARDGVGGTASEVFVGIDVHGDADAANPLEFWYAGLRLERALPLLSDRDYSADKIATDAVTSSAPAGAADEFRPPLVLLRVPGGGSSTDKYAQVEQLATRPDLEDGQRFSCHMRVQERGLGFVLAVSGGPQHAIAANASDFVALPDDDADEAVLDWRDNLVATVYVQGDSFVEERYPTDADLAASVLVTDEVRRLWLELPEAHLDYVVPGTVVHIADGDLVHSTGGWLPGRDDRARMKNIAQLAYEWYSEDRKALTLSYRQIRKVVEVGDLVVEIGSGATLESIRTVVTRVTYDLVAGHTTIQTEHIELNPGHLVPRRA